MTEKQKSIISAALQLFAEDGFKSTSTSKVATKAGVSEGLIFRHFKNKEGLLEAILKMGEEQAEVIFADIISETDPKQTLCKYLDLALNISQNKEAVDFWKLQFKIKWELEIYDEHKLAPLEAKLNSTFQSLEYEQPEEETNLLLTLMDGIVTRTMLQDSYDLTGTITYLKKKYEI